MVQYAIADVEQVAFVQVGEHEVDAQLDTLGFRPVQAARHRIEEADLLVANPRRIKRLQALVLQAAAGHVQGELDDPRIGLVTLTRVKLSSDLSRCQLYWSVLGDEVTVRTTERGLNDALPSIQRAVARAMQMDAKTRLRKR